MQVTTKIKFAGVYSRIVLQKEDVLILVIFKPLPIKGIKATPCHNRNTFNTSLLFQITN